MSPREKLAEAMFGERPAAQRDSVSVAGWHRCVAGPERRSPLVFIIARNVDGDEGPDRGCREIIAVDRRERATEHALGRGTVQAVARFVRFAHRGRPGWRPAAEFAVTRLRARRPRR